MRVGVVGGQERGAPCSRPPTQAPPPSGSVHRSPCPDGGGLVFIVPLNSSSSSPHSSYPCFSCPFPLSSFSCFSFSCCLYYILILLLLLLLLILFLHYVFSFILPLLLLLLLVLRILFLHNIDQSVQIIMTFLHRNVLRQAAPFRSFLLRLFVINF